MKNQKTVHSDGQTKIFSAALLLPPFPPPLPTHTSLFFIIPTVERALIPRWRWKLLYSSLLTVLVHSCQCRLPPFFIGGLECVGFSFASVAHFVFLRHLWIRTQRASRSNQARYQLSHPSPCHLAQADLTISTQISENWVSFPLRVLLIPVIFHTRRVLNDL